MEVYYKGNELDSTTKEDYGGTVLNKIVKQLINSEEFNDIFSIFDKDLLDVGYQVEELEVGDIEATDFDKTGTDALKKYKGDIKAIYHKINRNKQYAVSISDKQLRTAFLSRENLASMSNAIMSKLENSRLMDDYEAFKDLLHDIYAEKKNMTLVDMNGKGGNMDMLTKAIQTIADNMSLPSKNYSYMGFNRAVSKKENLVLIIDTATKAKLKVDSLASAFNMEEKELVKNIIVVDSLKDCTFANEKANAGVTIEIGDDTGSHQIKTYKCTTGGSAQVNGKPICILCDKKSIIRDKIDRSSEPQRNAKGRFTTIFANAEDMLSYSPLKNAVLFID